MFHNFSQKKALEIRVKHSSTGPRGLAFAARIRLPPEAVAVCLLFRMPIQITVGDQSPSPKQPKHARDPTHRHLWLSKFNMEMQLCCLCYHINATYHHGHTGPWRKFELTLDPDTYIPVRHGFRCSTPVVSCDWLFKSLRLIKRNDLIHTSAPGARFTHVEGRTSGGLPPSCEKKMKHKCKQHTIPMK
jgi:hypothetical protein